MSWVKWVTHPDARGTSFFFFFFFFFFALKKRYYIDKKGWITKDLAHTFGNKGRDICTKDLIQVSGDRRDSSGPKNIKHC